MNRRRLPLGLFVSVALAVLVATLATLQYRWLGQVSDAERDQKRTLLKQSAEEFADDFDREIGRVYVGLQVDGATLVAQNWAPFAARFDAWRAETKYPELIRSVYASMPEGDRTVLMQYQPETRTFATSSWPDDLAPVKAQLDNERRRLEESTGSGGGLRTSITLRQPLVPAVPAVLVTLPVFPALQSTQPGDLTTVFQRIGSVTLIAQLNREFIQSTMLPKLVERYFPSRSADQYRFAVVNATDVEHPIYSRGLVAGKTLSPDKADATVPLFGLRTELVDQVTVRQAGTAVSLAPRKMEVAGVPPGVSGPIAGVTSSSAKFSVFIDSTGPRGNNVFNFMTGHPNDRPAGWQLVLQHRAGSLDAAVGQTRARNLWLSFGILAVLAAGVGLLVVNAERSRRLAVQQMDFVATVSHELRTPLTVIRSAAQNLSAGVVHDAAQAKRYGDLIEDEGRRLTDMVEQVLEYAGLSGNRRLAHAHPVDPAAIVNDVVESCRGLFEAERFEVALDVASEVPAVMGDEGAIRRALHNLISNALKYGVDGRWAGISVRAARVSGHDEVQIAVRDRGRGIDTDDLPHIFEAFYRGRYAVDRQIHGNGLGLSLVKRIAEAHGGRITVASEPGEGATFTIHLPAAPGDRAAQPLAEPMTEAGSGQ